MKQTSKLNRKLDVIFEPPKPQEAAFFDQCPKFQSLHHPKNELERIVAYLYLKENQIQGKTFSQRRICKHDSTQIFDGPQYCRKLKINQPTSDKINGWQNVGGELAYIYDNGWKTKVAEICIDSHHNEQIAKHFSQKEEELKHDYKARIQYLKNYFDEINSVCKMDNVPESVKKCRAIYRKSRDQLKPYMKYKGTRFFEVLPLMKQKSAPQTLIQDFQAFQPLTDLKLKEKSKFLDDLFKHLNKHKRDTQEHSDEDIEVPIPPPEDIKFKRTFSQVQNKEVEEAQEFNQEHYLFEVKDVNSFGQQIRMNKMSSIMKKMFQSQHNFSKDLQGYAYSKLSPDKKITNISTDTLQMKKHDLDLQREKEIRRMSKSQIIPLQKGSRALQSAFATTSASQQHFK